MLDLAGLAYTGSNHIASAAAMDKDITSAYSDPSVSQRPIG